VLCAFDSVVFRETTQLAKKIKNFFFPPRGLCWTRPGGDRMAGVEGAILTQLQVCSSYFM
jgi:hypothetical protein